MMQEQWTMMKRLCIVMIIFSAMNWGTALAAGTAGTTGADLLSDCDAQGSAIKYGWCLGFIRAVWQISEKGCGPAGVPMDEVRLIFMKYATDNPEWLHRPAEEVIIAAIAKAFPCKPR
jgi:Rap1a immunity proteins